MDANNGFDVDSWLDQLDSDKPKSNGLNLVKVLMNTKTNKGTVIFIPFKNQANNNYYTKLTGVREFKYYEESFDTDIWHKILPIEYYRNLTDSQIALHNEITTLFDQIVEDEVVDYSVARYRSYVFMYCYILNHIDESGKTVDDTVKRPALLEFPSAKLITALSDAINSKISSLNSKEWVPMIFNDEPTGRQGMISVKISGGQGGYDFTIGLELQNQFAKVIPDDFDATQMKELFKDSIKDFLGWQSSDKDSLFHEEMMEQVRNQLILLKKGNQPIPENKNESTESINSESQSEQPTDQQADPSSFEPKRPF